MGNQPETNASSDLPFTGAATFRIVRNLTMTPEAGELLANLARETGSSEGEVLRLALGMFKTAVDAKKHGKHVGVAAKPEALDLEMVGFWHGDAWPDTPMIPRNGT